MLLSGYHEEPLSSRRGSPINIGPAPSSFAIPPTSLLASPHLTLYQPTLVLLASMPRYQAFVLLALSASSVLAAPQLPSPPPLPNVPVETVSSLAAAVAQAASDVITSLLAAAPAPPARRSPAELPQAPSVPDTTTITRPVLGERSNGKVYSSSTLRKRDWKYPTSTQDCRLSEVPEGSKTLSYTHDGQEYSQECLTGLALLVPAEKRESCRTTGREARGYDEECLFKKAFDEDWKFDVEKAKAEELAWRAANPSSSSSDAWRKQFPTSIADCSATEKVVKGGKKPTIKSSENGWSSYSVVPGTSEVVENDCLMRMFLGAELKLDLETCSAAERSSLLDISAVVGLVLGEGLEAVVDVAIGILGALRIGCLLDIVAKIIASVGMDAKLVVGLLEEVGEVVVFGLLELLAKIL